MSGNGFDASSRPRNDLWVAPGDGQRNGATCIGTLEDDLGEVCFVFCDARRTIAQDT